MESKQQPTQPPIPVLPCKSVCICVVYKEQELQ